MVFHILSVHDYYLLGGIPTLILLVIVLVALWSRKTNSDGSISELWDTDAIDNSDEPVVPTVIRARVADMRVETGYNGGYRNAKYGVAFVLVFEVEGGELLEFPVPEELYTTVEKDQVGMLVFVGKTFYDFGDGEPLPEENDGQDSDNSDKTSSTP